MPKPSSGSVKVTYFDKQGAWRALRAFVEELAATHREVERVVVFGSLARGDVAPGSHVDLLIVLSRSDRPFRDWIPIYTPSSLPVGADVFPYTEDEVARMLDEGNAFVRRAPGEGVELYRRNGGAVRRRERGLQLAPAASNPTPPLRHGAEPVILASCLEASGQMQ